MELRRRRSSYLNFLESIYQKQWYASLFSWIILTINSRKT